MPVLPVQLVLIGLIGYLWGSIPAGYWMGKFLRGRDFDIRDYGSRKIGATNVLRVLGRVPAAIVLAFDLTKGIVPTLLAVLLPFLHAAGWGPSLAAFMALIGHCYPIFIGFKGGRGVATGGGALLLLSWPTFLISCAAVILTIAIWRYVSLGSIMGSLAVIVCGIIFFIIGWNSLPVLIYSLAAPALVIALHYDNIGRLLSGKERKFGQKVETEDSAPSSTTKPSNLQL